MHREGENVYEISVRKFKGRDHFGDLQVDLKTIFKVYLNEYGWTCGSEWDPVTGSYES
jgi:hypothetical protein